MTPNQKYNKREVSEDYHNEYRIYFQYEKFVFIQLISNFILNMETDLKINL